MTSIDAGGHQVRLGPNTQKLSRIASSGLPCYPENVETGKHQTGDQVAIFDRLQSLQRLPSRTCYICQFHGSLLPERHRPVDRGKVNATVGTCHMCSVWACAWHGTRYGVFTCAKCRHGTAVSDVITDVDIVGVDAILAST